MYIKLPERIIYFLWQKCLHNDVQVGNKRRGKTKVKRRDASWAADGF